jgi:hypothetical protein
MLMEIAKLRCGSSVTIPILKTAGVWKGKSTQQLFTPCDQEASSP